MVFLQEVVFLRDHFKKKSSYYKIVDFTQGYEHLLSYYINYTMMFKSQMEGLDKGTGQNRLYCHTLNILLKNLD